LFDSGEWLTNEKLQSILAKKDEDHKSEKELINDSHNQEVKILEDIVEKRDGEILFLKKENSRLNNHIDKKLDDEVRRGQVDLNYKKENFDAEKRDFNVYKIREQAKLDKEKAEIKKNRKSLEIRENKVAEDEAKLKKHERKIIEMKKEFKIKMDKEKDELNKEKIKIKEDQDRREREIKNKNKELANKIKDERERSKKEWVNINKTKIEQQSEGKRLKKWESRLNKETYEKSIDNIINNLKSLNLKNKQQRTIILKPITCSGEPVIQSGFSSNIQYNKEDIMVKSDVDPVVQSGEKVKVGTSGREPVIQSGIPRTNSSGIGNFDKIS
jgi:hypothetical protein